MGVLDFISKSGTKKILKHMEAQKKTAKVSDILSGICLEDKEAGILATSIGHAYLKEKDDIRKKYFKNKLPNLKYLKLKLELCNKYIPSATQEIENFRFGLDQFHTARGTIVVIADSHINEMWAESAPALLSFLDYIQESRSDVSDIVLLGDIFDFQRGIAEIDSDTANLWREIVFLHEMGRIHLHYIYGNHDYILFPARIGKIKLPVSCFFPFIARDKLTLKSGGKAFLFTHGHELEKYPKWFYSPVSRAGEYFGTYIGPLLEKGYGMIEFVTGKTTGKTLSERTMVVKEYEKYAETLNGYGMFIHGHTELPYKKKRVSCPGSWNVRADGKRTFMEIQNGEIEIKQFFDKNRIHSLSDAILSEPKKPGSEFIRISIEEERKRWGRKKWGRKKWGIATLVQVAYETGDEVWKQRQETQKAKTAERRKMFEEVWKDVKEEEIGKEKEELKEMKRLVGPVIEEEEEKEKEELKKMKKRLEDK